MHMCTHTQTTKTKEGAMHLKENKGRMHRGIGWEKGRDNNVIIL